MKRFRICKGWGCGWNAAEGWMRWPWIAFDHEPGSGFYCLSIGAFYIERCRCCE